MKTLFLGALLALGAVGCDDDSGTSPDLAMKMASDMAMHSTGDAATTASVDVQDPMMYAPRNVTISKGGTVTWTWRGTTHSVTSDDGTSFDSGIQTTGATFSFTFDSAGTYPYHCLVHGQQMSGSVTVQ